MSRIGKQSIAIPAGIEVSVSGSQIIVKGPKGELKYTLTPSVAVQIEGGKVMVSRKADDNDSRSLHGLTGALINNMIVGVSKGFEKRMQILGVGYRAQVSGSKVTFHLGYSHPIEFKVPEGIVINMDKEEKNTIIVSGADKQLVGEVSANIRKFRPPEPYKGKGIRYTDEHVHRKAGKAAAKTTA